MISQSGAEPLFVPALAARHVPEPSRARKRVRQARERWLSESSLVVFLEDTAAGSPGLAAARRRASHLHDQVLEAMRELDEAHDQLRRA